MNEKFPPIYRIRNRATGLFSTGGTTPRFTLGGKVWAKRGSLLNHLNQFLRRDYLGANGYRYHNDILPEWDVVEIRSSGAILNYPALEFVKQTKSWEYWLRNSQ